MFFRWKEGRIEGDFYCTGRRGLSYDSVGSLSPILTNSSKKSSISAAPFMSSLFRAQNGARQVSPCKSEGVLQYASFSHLVVVSSNTI